METSLREKTIIVTGASSGIGECTALELAKMGAQVILACRPGEKSERVFQKIAAQATGKNVELLPVDLSLQSSIRSFAREFLKKHSRLDVLVNNAGVYLPKRQETGEGIEATFAINHCAYFLLTNLLLDAIKTSGAARIINVSSEAHRAANLDMNDLQSRNGYGGMKAYSRSKLANILFTYELARRLAKTPVTVNCLHPGLVNTGFARDSKGLFKLGFQLIRPLMLTPEKGAITSVFLASSPTVAGMTGRYFNKCKPVQPSPASYNVDLAQKLWEATVSLTRM